MDSALRPREIQSRIRSGETLDEVAQAAGVPAQQIEPFAAPVLAERGHVALMAMQSGVRRRGGATSVETLHDIAGARLKARGLDVEDVEWDAWRNQDRRWTVQAKYLVDGERHQARFIFDMAGRFSNAINDDARWLLAEGDPRTRAPKANDRDDELALVRAVSDQPDADEATDEPDEANQPTIPILLEDDAEAADDEPSSGASPQEIADEVEAEIDAYDVIPEGRSELDVLYDMLGGISEDSINVYSGLTSPVLNDDGRIDLDQLAAAADLPTTADGPEPSAKDAETEGAKAQDPDQSSEEAPEDAEPAPSKPEPAKPTEVKPTQQRAEQDADAQADEADAEQTSAEPTVSETPAPGAAVAAPMTADRVSEKPATEQPSAAEKTSEAEETSAAEDAQEPEASKSEADEKPDAADALAAAPASAPKPTPQIPTQQPATTPSPTPQPTPKPVAEQPKSAQSVPKRTPALQSAAKPTTELEPKPATEFEPKPATPTPVPKPAASAQLKPVPQPPTETRASAPRAQQPTQAPKPAEKPAPDEPEQLSLVDLAEDQQPQPKPQQRRRTRKKRASVPSWDEIMFGSPTPKPGNKPEGE